MSIVLKAAKVEYQHKRWIVELVYEGLPLCIRGGSGDSPEEAFLMAARQAMEDARADAAGLDTDCFRAAVREFNQQRMKDGKPVVSFDLLPTAECSQIYDRAQEIKKNILALGKNS